MKGFHPVEHWRAFNVKWIHEVLTLTEQIRVEQSKAM